MENFGPEDLHKGRMEKPPFLYHGSLNGDIKVLEPREGHTPAEGVGKRIYATQLPAWAAAHSWDWSSDEGIRLSIEDEDRVLLQVPRAHAERLDVPVFIYRLPSGTFNLLPGGSGYTFDSTEKVRTADVQKFNSVKEAVEHFGGKVVIIG